MPARGDMRDHSKLAGTVINQQQATYTHEDTILYALALGFGTDPVDDKQLRYVYEENLRALPTLAVVLAYPGFWMKQPEYGFDWKQVLHAEETVEILRILRPRYEAHHKVKIEDDALEAAARLSQRYISERLLPDKAVDLIDEAASRVRIDTQLLPSVLQEKESRLRQLQNEEEAAFPRAD